MIDLSKIETKWIYPKVDKIVLDPQLDDNKKLKTEWNRPQGIVLHHTAGNGIEGLLDWFCSTDLSCHFLIGKKKGQIIQMAPVNYICTHAGGNWPLDKPSFVNVNLSFVGIEIENTGQLTKKNGKYVDWNGKPFIGDPSAVRERHVLDEKYWEAFTDFQEKAVFDICLWLIERFDIKIDNIIGHYECVKTGKVDPAGGFSQGLMPEVRDYIRELIQM